MGEGGSVDIMGRPASDLCQGAMSSGSWSAGGGDGGRAAKFSPAGEKGRSEVMSMSE